MTETRRKAARAAFLIFAGCCLNVVTLEQIKEREKILHPNNAKGAVDAVTFGQFAFVSAVGVVSRLVSGSWRSGGLLESFRMKIPLLYHLGYVGLFFTVSVVNNQALDHKIPIPLHIVFRSGSLVTSLILGALVLRKKYTISRILSVFVVTAGIIASLLAEQASSGLSLSRGRFDPDFLVGLGMLTTAMVLSSVMGIFQEATYNRYGKENTEEHLFYSHLLSLPLFLPLVNKFLPLVKFWDVTMYLWFLANFVTQWICIRGVFEMAGAAGALSMTLTISLRKFVSLVFSIWWFRHPFTAIHWFGTTLVFAGTFLYSVPLGQPAQTPKRPVVAKQKKQKAK